MLIIVYFYWSINSATYRYIKNFPIFTSHS